MLIRNWESSDNYQIAELEKICFSDAWTLQMVEKTQGESSFIGFVCEVQGEVVGYAGAICAYDLSDIALVAVKPEFRRKGIAQNLLKSLEQALLKNGVKKIYLEVRKSNENAQNLYTKCGFYPIGIRKKYYENTEDAIVMEKVI